MCAPTRCGRAGAPMLWLKTFHIVFVVAWFAGLFYLPRLFIYHLEATEPREHERFVVMERRLLAITHIGAAGALLFGIALLLTVPVYLKFGWLHAKLAGVLLLIVYHGYCVRLAADFRNRRNTKSSRWLRIYNEAPGVLLIAIVALVVLKPF